MDVSCLTRQRLLSLCFVLAALCALPLLKYCPPLACSLVLACSVLAKSLVDPHLHRSPPSDPLTTLAPKFLKALQEACCPLLREERSSSRYEQSLLTPLW